MIALIAAEVVKGIEYLHSMNIIHRDIKPANLLLDSSNQVKISDLGVSVEVEDSYLISGQVTCLNFLLKKNKFYAALAGRVRYY